MLQAQKLGAHSMQPRAFDDRNDVWTVLLVFSLYSCQLHGACLKTLPPAPCLLLHQWTWGFVPTLVYIIQVSYFGGGDTEGTEGKKF